LLLNGLAPVLGIAIDRSMICYVFFRTLLTLAFKRGSGIVRVGVAWEVLGICRVAAVWLRRSATRRKKPLVTTVE
jgi:hypothetical protein